MGAKTATSEKKRSGCMEWLKGPTCALYVNFFLSAWGDRMWFFSVGLFLVYFDDGVLLLAAIYGFAQGGAVLFLGGPIGNWVDKNGRLKVVRVTLFIQNFSVMLSALCVAITLRYEDDLKVWWDGNMEVIAHTAIIVLAIIAELASVGYKIAIEKDWMVIVAAGDKGHLANLNAVTRSVDLMNKVLAPTAVGMVMTYASLLTAAVVIAGWNLVSVFVEYALLCRVYRQVPRLAYKGDEVPEEYKDATVEETEKMMSNGDVKKTPNGLINGDVETPAEKEPLTNNNIKEEEKEQETEKAGCCRLVFEPILTLMEGWSTYIHQKVVFAGLSLACLYMTVLGFDSITVGYMYSQGLTETVLGIATALAGVTGILGTFLFTQSRKYIGLERTGIIAFSLEIMCLLLAVASVWAPGSPFDLDYASKPEKIPCSDLENVTLPILRNGSFSLMNLGGRKVNASESRSKRSLGDLSEFTFEVDPGMSHVDHMFHKNSFYPRSAAPLSRTKRDAVADAHEDEVLIIDESMAAFRGRELAEGTARPNVECEEEDKEMSLSIILFILGIITSRVGLWMADLVVTQLLQENVIETERGVVNGVQNSLNMLMDVIKFTLVIIAPRVETFGILIVLSFGFICLGGSSFGYHSYRSGECCFQASCCTPPQEVMEDYVVTVDKEKKAVEV